MTQSKLESLIEAKVNTVIGMVVSFVLGMYLYPMFGFNVTPAQNVTIMAIFTVVSVIRSYTIRRIFNRRLK